jgi:hypothetical protein
MLSRNGSNASIIVLDPSGGGLRQHAALRQSPHSPPRPSKSPVAAQRLLIHLHNAPSCGDGLFF